MDILQAVTAADDSDRMRKVFESKASGVSTFCLYLSFKTSGVRISLHPYFAYILTFLHIMIPQDEDRMVKLEDELKAVRTKAEEADKAYDEVFKKIQVDNIEDRKCINTGKLRNRRIYNEYRMFQFRINQTFERANLSHGNMPPESFLGAQNLI